VTEKVVEPTVPDTTPGQAAPRAAEPDLTGQALGDFQVLRRLGQGGMGQVYLAEQVSLKRKVALKLLKPELAANHVSLQRFKQEAEVVARATHANIVQIYAIDERGGHNFMALEYVEGKNLREYLEKKGPPDILLGLSIMAQVASALERASELGIIHRDIKPENILLTRKGEVKVADFGLSRCFAEAGPAAHLTQSGITMGTPLYMSPEQVESRPVDHRTDIYSLGVTCYHMFAGTPPFRGQSPLEVAYQHVHKEPEPLGCVRPDLPPELCAIVHRMMAKDPAERYQTGREVAREVSRLRDMLVALGVTGGGSQVLAGLSSEGLRSSATHLIPPMSTTPFWQRRGVMAATLLAALAGGLAFGWVRAQRPEAGEAAATSGLSAEDAAAVKELFSVREHERKLQRLVQEHLKPANRLDLNAGLKHSLDLGLLYLRERRLDDAEQFFKEIDPPGKKIPPPYHLLGQIGQAVVLAFRDEPAKSNKLFEAITEELQVFDKTPGAPKLVPRKSAFQQAERLEAYHLLWKDNVPVRELVARALDHNKQNDPAGFPDKLERYRQPPPPTLRAP
jgi:tRNA A-37 threonylcarbamoyl transferase component Bud32